MGNKKSRPNILIIISDQLNSRAVDAYKDSYGYFGNGFTPNISRIAEKGVTFESVYTPTPLCRPARAAFWTGLYPHQTNVLTNGKRFKDPKPDDSISTLGELFTKEGYLTIHVGKKHDHGTLRGFETVKYGYSQAEVEHKAWPVNKDSHRDEYTRDHAIKYINEFGTQDPENSQKPFLLVADLINPHNICGWVGENQGEHENIEPPIELPPLPENFEIDDWENRPPSVQYVCCTHRRLKQAAIWTKEDYRHYMAAYLHYTHRVDRDIGQILDTLEDNGLAQNTLIVFFADHGDGCAFHRMVTKQVSLYDETTNVPFIVSGKWVKRKGENIQLPLASLLDLLPTLCDFAGIDIPQNRWGKSLMPVLTSEGNEGNIERKHHQYVVSEWFSEWGFTISPGRMLRTKNYKYIRYIEGTAEELYDMRNDPGETKNLAQKDENADVLQEHRDLLNEFIDETNDNFFLLEPKVDKKWRSHELGYQNHEGLCAPGDKKWYWFLKPKLKLDSVLKKK